MKPHGESSPFDIETLARAVGRLSRLLTVERDRLADDYLRDRGLREAYLRYFLPANRAKVGIPLGELDRHPAALLVRDTLRVLDIGSGPGTSILGVLDFFRDKAKRPALEITAVDGVKANLTEAERLFRGEAGRYGRPAKLRTIVRTIGSAADRIEDRCDLLILSNVLNELFRDQSDRLARRSDLLARMLEGSLAPDGSCVIIEPALRETSRDLLAVRDEMARAGFTVFSPCLRQGPCPALTDPKDWCHEDRPWDPPSVIREIDERIGLRKDALKFSYLVLRRDGSKLADCFPEGAFRVVSEPLVSKGKRELFLCGREGRLPAMRQDKDAAPGNALFGELRRGDVVRFENPLDGEKRLRVTKDTVVLAGQPHRDRLSPE